VCVCACACACVCVCVGGGRVGEKDNTALEGVKKTLFRAKRRKGLPS